MSIAFSNSYCWIILLYKPNHITLYHIVFIILFIISQPGLSQTFDTGGTLEFSLSYMFPAISLLSSYLALYIPYVACPHHPYNSVMKNSGNMNLVFRFGVWIVKYPLLSIEWLGFGHNLLLLGNGPIFGTRP